jgi:hypothetical protein
MNSSRYFTFNLMADSSSTSRKVKLNAERTQALLHSVLIGELPVTEVDPDHLPSLIVALKDDRDDKIAHRRTDEAELSDRYLHLSRQRYNEVTRLRDQQAREGRIRLRYESAVEELNDVKAKFEMEDQEMREANARKRAELREKQEHELQQLREIWRKPEKGKFFNRTSSLLRGMRRQTILLLNDHRYDDMRRSDILANMREEWETDWSHHVMNSQYIYAQKLMEAKHEHEMEVMIHAQDVRLGEHDVRGEAEMAVIQLKIDHLKRKLDFYSDPAKVWALFGRNNNLSGGKKKGSTMALLPAPKAKNPHYLTLPPLTGPMSARRKSASKRNTNSVFMFE